MTAQPVGAGGAERLRFKDFSFKRLASGRCQARVVLGWSDGRQFIGESAGVTSQTGELRCGAAAAVHALAPAVRDSAAQRADSLAPRGDAAAGAGDSAAALQRLVQTPSRDSAPPAVRGEEVAKEAERLFGAEGRAAIGAAPTPGEPSFD